MKPKENFNLIGNSSEHITEPSKGDGTYLVLAISSSELLQSTLLQNLSDLGYRVAGPYASVDSAHTFLRDVTPDLIIFDIGISNRDISTMKQLLHTDYENTPVLFISNSDVSIPHKYKETVRYPVDPIILRVKLEELLNTVSRKLASPAGMMINFLNEVFEKMVELGLDNTKYDINEVINIEMDTLSSGFEGLNKKNDLLLEVKDPHQLELHTLINILKSSLLQIIQNIDERCQSNWARSLLTDAVETVIINRPKISRHITELFDLLNINTSLVKSTIIRTGVPKVTDPEKIVFVAYMTLADLGPELRKVVFTNEKIIQGLDDGVASQIITLVGQGSSYHEGMFGPIPIPTANNIIGLLRSKMMKSDIKDQRMRGQSLSVITIGFYRSLITRIPSREKMKEIFAIFDDIDHVNMVTDEMLNKIKNDFLNELT
ncbi:MAG: hypothetical protein ACXAB7_00930 [Candidatus Kariarchaeaceae archaeon]|jgi:hypothetical protein